MRLAWIAMFAIALSACAARAPRETLPAIEGVPSAHQEARVAAIEAMPTWSMSGRVAVSNGKDGGSGRIEWKQTVARFEVALAAPITRKSWRVTGGEGEAVLEGLEGGPRTGANAHDLLLDATRWDIPVDALSDWVLGAPKSTAAVQYDANGRPLRVEQDGWTVSYTDWAPVEAHPDIVLPARLEATKGEARVRLAIDGWSFEP